MKISIRKYQLKDSEKAQTSLVLSLNKASDSINDVTAWGVSELCDYSIVGSVLKSVIMGN